MTSNLILVAVIAPAFGLSYSITLWAMRRLIDLLASRWWT